MEEAHLVLMIVMMIGMSVKGRKGRERKKKIN